VSAESEFSGELLVSIQVDELIQGVFVKSWREGSCDMIQFRLRDETVGTKLVVAAINLEAVEVREKREDEKTRERSGACLLEK
jgi:hypothetical protein